MATRKKSSSGKKKTTAKKTAKKSVRKKTVAKKARTTKKPAARKAATKKKAAARKTAKKVSKKATTKSGGKKTAVKKSAAKSTRRKAAGASPRRAAKKTGRRRTAKTSAVTGPVPGIEPYARGAGEEYMNDEQRAHFRELLRAWKADLMQEVDRTVHHMKDDAANFPDPNDRATQESEFSLELRTRDRERKLIKKIDEAIATLDAGDYGYCESCGIEIGIRRLEARPTATLCIDCKTLDEIREKQMRA